MAEAEPGDDLGARLPIGDVLAQQVFTGDAEVDGALPDLARYFRGGQERHLDAVDALEARPVFAVVVGQADGKARLGQYFQRLFLETAFRGDRQRDHDASPRRASIRSIQTEKPTPGMVAFAPSSVSSLS